MSVYPSSPYERVSKPKDREMFQRNKDVQDLYSLAESEEGSFALAVEATLLKNKKQLEQRNLDPNHVENALLEQRAFKHSSNIVNAFGNYFEGRVDYDSLVAFVYEVKDRMRMDLEANHYFDRMVLSVNKGNSVSVKEMLKRVAPKKASSPQ